MRKAKQVEVHWQVATGARRFVIREFVFAPDRREDGDSVAGAGQLCAPLGRTVAGSGDDDAAHIGWQPINGMKALPAGHQGEQCPAQAWIRHDYCNGYVHEVSLGAVAGLLCGRTTALKRPFGGFRRAAQGCEPLVKAAGATLAAGLSAHDEVNG